MLSGLTEVLPSAVQFAEEVGGIYSDLQTMKDCFSSADENTAWEDWFTPADSALSSLNDRFDSLAKPVAEMTAWVVLRTDEENHEGNNATNLS